LRILGIDVGTKNLGYATIEVEKGSKPKVIDAGVVKFKENRIKDRIKELIEGLDNILKNRVDEVVIEDIFLAYNPRSVLKLAQFRGAIIMKIVTDIGDYSEYSPLEIKKSITGNGKASKEQVSFMVKKILNIKGEINHLISQMHGSSHYTLGLAKLGQVRPHFNNQLIPKDLN